MSHGETLEFLSGVYTIELKRSRYVYSLNSRGGDLNGPSRVCPEWQTDSMSLVAAPHDTESGTVSIWNGHVKIDVLHFRTQKQYVAFHAYY